MSRRRANPDDPDVGAAFAKYREFHRYDPKDTGSFPASFVIPAQLYRAGKSKWVTYRSGKIDPETLKRPRRPINYIHEHDAGVVTYVADAIDDAPLEDVPERFRSIAALTRLGFCLGFCFEDPTGHECEASGTAPLPDLYTTPDGHCLLVIQDRRKVLAMMWGGGLGVFARGIDG